MCECCNPTKYVISGVFLLILCGGFIAMALLLPPFIKIQLRQGIIQQRMVTSNTSTGYSLWQSNGGAGPQYLNVYAWNITNVEQVLNGSKPKLQQVGPYVYDWKWHRFDVSFSSDDQLISFFHSESFIFNRDMTDSSLDPYTDQCTFPSIPYAAVRANLQTAQNKSYDTDDWVAALELDLVSSFASSGNYSTDPVPVDQTSPFLTTTVDKYIWGYDDGFIAFLKNMSLTGANTTTHFVIENNSTSDAQTRIDKKFPSVMFTGQNNTKNFNQFQKWEGMERLVVDDIPLWGNLNNNGKENANHVYGSDGYGFDVEISQDSLILFVDELFRHVILFSNTTEVLSGIKTFIYELNQTEFNNVTTMPEYNLYGPNGILNITQVNAATRGSPVPVSMSQPLFYQSDPYYASQVEFDRVANNNDHNTMIWVEPTTGITMKARKRLQANLLVEGSLLLYPKLQKMFIPIAWFEESADLPSSLAAQWKARVGIVLAFLEAIPLIGYCLAGFMLLLSSTMFVFSFIKTSGENKRGYSALN